MLVVCRGFASLPLQAEVPSKRKVFNFRVLLCMSGRLLVTTSANWLKLGTLCEIVSTLVLLM